MATAVRVLCVSYGHRANGAGNVASARAGAERVQLHEALSARICWLPPEHKSSTLLFQIFFFFAYFDMKKSYRTETHPAVTLSSLV